MSSLSWSASDFPIDYSSDHQSIQFIIQLIIPLKTVPSYLVSLPFNGQRTRLELERAKVEQVQAAKETADAKLLAGEDRWPWRRWGNSGGKATWILGCVKKDETCPKVSKIHDIWKKNEHVKDPSCDLFLDVR